MQSTKKSFKKHVIQLVFAALTSLVHAQLPKTTLSLGAGLLGGNGKIMTESRGGLILKLSDQLVKTASVYQMPIHGTIMTHISPRFAIGLDVTTVAVKQEIVRDVGSLLTFDGRCSNFAGRVNYYFVQKTAFQFYGGGSVGLSLTKGNAVSKLASGQIFNLPDYKDNFLYANLVVGGRYFFMDNVGIYSELGMITLAGQGTITTQLGIVAGF
jgi:hypothetical protein